MTKGLFMISVIIPTYRNKKLLIDNLKHNLLYLKDCEIIVVNDDPGESLKNLIDSRRSLPRTPIRGGNDRGGRGNDKKIILIENKKNLGFGQSIPASDTSGQVRHIRRVVTALCLLDANQIFSFHRTPCFLTSNPLA